MEMLSARPLLGSTLLGNSVTRSRFEDVGIDVDLLKHDKGLMRAG